MMPPICQQIVDHINSYMTVTASRFLFPDPPHNYGSVLTVATRLSDLDPEQQRRAAEMPYFVLNRVAELPYRSPGVEDATHAVMRQALASGPLYLYSAVSALVWSRPHVSDDDASLRSAQARALVLEQEIHDAFWRVPFLSENLLRQVALRLGHPECAPLAGPADHRQEIPRAQVEAALRAMAKGFELQDGTFVFGFAALSLGLPDLDPNLIVALSRAARGSMAEVPTLEEAVAALREIGADVIEPSGSLMGPPADPTERPRHFEGPPAPPA